jgi:uncharacterized protein
LADNVTRVYPCPRCQKKIKYDSNSSFRPFCCQPCKDGDIIDWADEKYAVGVEPADPEELIEEMQRRMKEDD